jgi:tRNA dimethylallyltransferase
MNKAKLKSQIPCILGPTAAGKTDIAIELCQTASFEIISVDSAMIYRGMDIGTAKPDAATLAKTPHRLINILEPEAHYSAADFVRDANREIADCLARGKTPLLVGGTMLYFKALQQGLSNLPEADAEIRATILQEATEKGWEALHAELQAIDPESAAKIHPNDPQRLQRALEIYRLTGKPRSQHWLDEKKTSAYEFINFAIIPEDRALLHNRIAQRFQQMLDQGFLEEVKTLMQRPGLDISKPSMRTVGYRQAWQYLQGDYSFEEMREKAIAATRQLAKRQLTWLRSWPDLKNLDSFANEALKHS